MPNTPLPEVWTSLGVWKGLRLVLHEFRYFLLWHGDLTPDRAKCVSVREWMDHAGARTSC